jgi:sugar lactone lactonase YvrE
VLASGLGLPEAPRWYRGRLWFSDVWACEVRTLAPDGSIETVVTVPARPNGLGFLPDGRLLIVSTTDRRLLVNDGAGQRQAIDLSPYTHDLCNDMGVDALGHAWIGDYCHAPGRDGIERQANARGANLVLVDFAEDPLRPATSVVAADLLVPNGMVVTDGGATLVVAETGGRRLTAFDIAADGTLRNRRTWANLDVPPDGLCLASDGRIWVASPFSPSCVQLIEEGGRVAERIDVAPAAAFACALGGEDGCSLYLLEANFPTQPADRQGRIRVLAT